MKLGENPMLWLSLLADFGQVPPPLRGGKGCHRTAATLVKFDATASYKIINIYISHATLRLKSYKKHFALLQE